MTMFGIGESVLITKGKVAGEKGEVVEIEKSFLEVDEEGNFNRDGLLTMESTITSIKLPYTFDGETLKVEHPERDYGNWVQKKYTHTAKFYQNAYTIRLQGKGYLVMVTEDHLKRNEQ